MQRCAVVAPCTPPALAQGTRRYFSLLMKALRIDPWKRAVNVVHLDIWPATAVGGRPYAQEDKALLRSLGCNAPCVVRPLPGIEHHRLILHPDQQYLMAGPVFSFQKEPRRWFGGHAFILALDEHGFHLPCRMAPLDVRAFVRFR